MSCCPTNVARTVASLGSYLASVDDDGVQLHQYAPATVRASLPAGDVVLSVETAYPADGRVVVTVVEAPDAPVPRPPGRCPCASRPGRQAPP